LLQSENVLNQHVQTVRYLKNGVCINEVVNYSHVGVYGCLTG
jgi:hypothetical protein